MNQLPAELFSNPLYVFALAAEAADEFAHVPALFVGVGKVNAAYYLLKKISLQPPSIIINLGSAGSHTFARGEVVCCTRFIQRDMDVTALGFEKYKTPFSEHPPVLHYGLQAKGLPTGICGSGDSFETRHTTSDYNVIDMEAFPLAWIAAQEQIPFLCLKYISDGANGSAGEDWSTMVHHAAAALKSSMLSLAV
ncbi:adenosylhomocysteine nucleosidase [Chitinophaga costaii]|uniref:Adenosylhomocysteine nucleosidase n=1 Tax=Chitinophaga costaii TaxID=1335309 RepID=A0A1C4FMS6_9BACT|nr:nucleosidase [Chitinophaga costaii]PUZ29928.1 nucleosidase [Chitinophaga costaii]SCC57268.1 adenosylhomocysteine nucleosidase [Chitinophaga costaii]